MPRFLSRIRRRFGLRLKYHQTPRDLLLSPERMRRRFRLICQPARAGAQFSRLAIVPSDTARPRPSRGCHRSPRLERSIGYEFLRKPNRVRDGGGDASLRGTFGRRRRAERECDCESGAPLRAAVGQMRRKRLRIRSEAQEEINAAF